MNIRRSPTASMISERAGVSKSTVSRALKGHPSIPKSTRDRVLAIARELGYEPNAMARSLVTLRSGVIGYVIGEIENPFYQEHLERLTKITAERDMQLMLFQVARDGDLADVVPSMARYRLEGCIVIASVPTSREAIDACARYSIPVVLLNRVVRDGAASSVLCNSRAGAQEIARFLVEGGHQRIAFLRGRPGSVVSEDRELGFREGLAAAGAPLFAEQTGHFRFEAAYQAAVELLRRTPRPDAI
ncbi:MAG: LacI family DNA-binding transcriptional regulator, partial [Tistlia sp.]